MPISVFPKTDLHLFAPIDPVTLRERLARHTVPRRFVPRMLASEHELFEGTLRGEEFRLQLVRHSADRLNPVVRGSIRAWEGGAVVDARVSLNWAFALQTIAIFLVFMFTTGFGGSFVSQALYLAAFVGILLYNKAAVRRTETTFLREIQVLAELHDTYEANA